MNSPLPVSQGQASPTRPRMTRNDQMVFGCLEDTASPMKAYDLLEALKRQGINAPMTVYRALSRLTDRGLVQKIESLNAYIAVPQSSRGQYCAFILCDQCHAVRYQALAPDAVQALVPDIEVKQTSIEIRTSCFGEDACPKHAR